MNWDWQVFCKDIITSEAVPGCFGRGEDFTYLNWIFKAWGWTVRVGRRAGAGACSRLRDRGDAHPAARSAGGRFWNAFATAWVELFRTFHCWCRFLSGILCCPALMPVLKTVPSFVLVVCALGFFTSARIAEQVRAGIQSLPRGQRYAGQALGMQTWQTYRYVLMPMALRIILPPLTSESMNLVKNSAAAFAVSIAELTQYAMQVAEETSRPIEVYLPSQVLYIVTAFAINRILGFIEKRTRVPGLIAASRTPGGR
jgi:amino acid ABC transporter membrane protein 1, PAAT family (TC 3.A.1.3.-)